MVLKFSDLIATQSKCGRRPTKITIVANDEPEIQFKKQRRCKKQQLKINQRRNKQRRRIC